ncbi:MAG: 2-oxo acid dehydrogenase subunit E2 [Aldersonia sp.]|nr:2-oxo acid dehydrogenase subunit E2 [Aldersonia sp.]
MAGVQEFRLPDLGEGLTEAELVNWLVKPGDAVTLNQTVAEVETAKALVELPSPFAGTVSELLAQPGDTIVVGAPLIRIADESVDTGAPEEETAAAPEEEAEQRQSVLVGYGPSDTPAVRRRRPTPPSDRTDSPSSGRPDAVPAARRRARELGIDLHELVGTGGSGAITVADVERRTRPDGIEGDRETRIPIVGVRKRTAAAMVQSAQTIPQVTEFVTADVTASVDLIDRLRVAYPEVKFGPLALVAKVVLTALAEHPTLNSRWDEEHQEIVLPRYVNLGIAVASERGLLVPSIKDAQQLSLRELAGELATVAAAARAGKSTTADLLGGTFTITNIGTYGIDAGTPLVNPGEAAILCLGTFAKRPWVAPGTDEITVRWVTTLGLSFDHRLVDGEQASKFLADVAAMLTEPAQLFGRL